MTQGTRGGRSQTVSDEDLLEAIDAAIEAGDTQINGLPGYSDVTEHVPLSLDRVRSRCYTLQDGGLIAIDETVTLDTGSPCVTLRRADDGD